MRKKQTVLRRKKNSKELTRIETAINHDAVSKDFEDKVKKASKVKAIDKTAKTLKTEVKSISTRIKKEYKDFAELKKHLNDMNEKTFVSFINKLTLTKSLTINQLFNIVTEAKKTIFKSNNDMRTVSKLKNHINCMSDRNWVYKVNKNKTFRLIDYNEKTAKRIF